MNVNIEKIGKIGLEGIVIFGVLLLLGTTIGAAIAGVIGTEVVIGGVTIVAFLLLLKLHNLLWYGEPLLQKIEEDC